MSNSKEIDNLQKEYAYHIRIANDVGYNKPIRVDANKKASSIRTKIKELKNLNVNTVKLWETCSCKIPKKEKCLISGKIFCMKCIRLIEQVE